MEPSIKFSYLDDYRIIKTLGSGYHAKVKLAEKDGQFYAIKKFKKETATLETLMGELNMMKNLNHQNVARLIDIKQTATYRSHTGAVYECFAIVLEYISGGDLFEYIATAGRFSEPVARTYFHMLIEGLKYIHSMGISHRDIKPENILLSGDFRLKITDFGFATRLERGILHTKLGTEGYMAPEIRNKNYDGQKVDLFAAGVILFILYSGGPPFEKATPTDPYYKVLSAKNYNVFWGAHAKRKPAGFFTDNFKSLINSMLALNPEERLSIEKIQQHPWYTGDVLLIDDLQEEFKKRKEMIEKKQEAERAEKEKRRAAREQAFGANRSGGDSTFEAIFESSAVEDLPKLARKTEKDDYIVKMTAQGFLASLVHFLEKKETNLIFEEDENFEVTHEGAKVPEFINPNLNSIRKTLDHHQRQSHLPGPAGLLLCGPAVERGRGQPAAGGVQETRGHGSAGLPQSGQSDQIRILIQQGLRQTLAHFLVDNKMNTLYGEKCMCVRCKHRTRKNYSNC